MYNRQLTSLEVSTELFQIEPIQHYIGYLAKHCQIPENKLFHLDILIEEVFTHIVSEAFENKPNGEIKIIASVSHSNFILQFHYLGIPFGYSMTKVKNEQDQISLTLIQNLSSSYKMLQKGKEGQIVEIDIALPPHVEENLIQEQTNNGAPIFATDKVELRQIRESEMEMLVQCLYNVFGYTYSAEGIYYPEVILERMHQGIYKGFVAINEAGKVIAHVAMLKETPDSKICESGQAFVSPEYGKRGLFHKLKEQLIQNADAQGLHGVMSSAVTGHPFTQKANVALGGIETGFELAYIPSNLQSVISREGEEERQSVASYFIPTSHQIVETIYPPANHQEMISKTFDKLNLKRIYHKSPIITEFPLEKSEINMDIKTEWNQATLRIKNVGKDFIYHIKSLARQALGCGTAVIYVSLDLTDPHTPSICLLLEDIGFFYSGIMPYEINGNDALRLQLLINAEVSPEYLIVVDDWAESLKDYVFKCKSIQEKSPNSII